MGNILNIINEDYELLNQDYYFIREYDSTIKNKTIESKLKTLGVDNFNYCTLKEAISRKDNTYVYFIFKQAKYTFDENTRYFSENLLSALRENDNIKLVYFIEDESVEFENLLLIDEYTKYENLNQKNVYVYNNNANMDLFLKENNSNLNVFKSSFLPVTYSNKFANFDVNYNFNRNFLFLIQNKRLKAHRFATLCFLLRSNIIEKTDWSFLENKRNGNIDLNLVNLLIDGNIYNNEINRLLDVDLKKNYHESSYNDYSTDLMKLETFEDSYINLVTESHFIESDIHITEKSYKPFYFYQIPIIIATKGHIKKMKELYGYDFFDDLVDHSYDDIENHKERITMIFKEIYRLHKIENDVVNFFKTNQNRFLKNNEITRRLKNINESNFFYNL
jgi:hypothetical protein